MLKLTELIDKYLQGELNPEELKDFEEKLKTDKRLQIEIDLQKKILKGIELASIHKQVSTARQNYLVKSILLKSIIILLIAAGVGTLAYMASHKNAVQSSSTNNDLDTQQFVININQDTLLETKNGMVFIIPAHAFDTESDSVEIKIEEALDAASIMMKGLSTVSDSLLLETAGMFKFSAHVKGNDVNIVKAITTSLPTDEIDNDMMLFKGEEDSKGNINWLNPKKLQQELVTLDIENLNFFPRGYQDIIDKLYTIKGINEESKSIYFEMSGYCEHSLHKEPSESITIPKTGEFIGASYTQTAKTAVEDTLESITIPITGNFIGTSYTQTANAVAESNDSLRNYERSDCEIDPSRIRAIWNKKFNHTILATKEFEERLHFIFTTCNPDFLDQYINNLDKPLYYIDSLCSVMATDAQRAMFQEYYGRRTGGVNITNKAIAKLHTYYEKKQDAYKVAASKTWKDYYDKMEKENQQFIDKSLKHSMEESERSSKIFNEEFCKNLTNAYEQIGVKHNCGNFDGPKTQAYTFAIQATGWYNLDVYVAGATLQRKTLDYTDPTSGKKARIEYAECKIAIENFARFELINVYALPEELSSFQKVRQKDDLFVQSLNMSFNNDIAVVAKKEKDWYWYTIKQAQGKTYSIVLNPIKEFQLKIELNRFNHSKKKDIMDDMAYYEYAEEYQQGIKKRKIEAEEKNRIAKVIFPCKYQHGVLQEVPNYQGAK